MSLKVYVKGLVPEVALVGGGGGFRKWGICGQSDRGHGDGALCPLLLPGHKRGVVSVL